MFSITVTGSMACINSFVANVAARREGRIIRAVRIRSWRFLAETSSSFKSSGFRWAVFLDACLRAHSSSIKKTANLKNSPHVSKIRSRTFRVVAAELQIWIAFIFVGNRFSLLIWIPGGCVCVPRSQKSEEFLRTLLTKSIMPFYEDDTFSTFKAHPHGLAYSGEFYGTNGRRIVATEPLTLEGFRLQ